MQLPHYVKDRRICTVNGDGHKWEEKAEAVGDEHRNCDVTFEEQLHARFEENPNQVEANDE